MPIPVICFCGKSFRVADAMAGRVGRCPDCKTVLRVPAFVPAAPPIDVGAPSISLRPARAPSARRTALWLLGGSLPIVAFLAVIAYGIYLKLYPGPFVTLEKAPKAVGKAAPVARAAPAARRAAPAKVVDDPPAGPPPAWRDLEVWVTVVRVVGAVAAMILPAVAPIVLARKGYLSTPRWAILAGFSLSVAVIIAGFAFLSLSRDAYGGTRPMPSGLAWFLVPSFVGGVLGVPGCLLASAFHKPARSG